MMQVEELHQHPTLWFPDGNVILSAIKSPEPKPAISKFLFSDEEDSDSESVQASRAREEEKKVKKVEKILYKLHKSILAKHSKVFENMFALPGLHGDIVVGNVVSDAGENQATTIDVPVITMTEESMELESLIDVLYDPLVLTRLRRYDYDPAFQLEALTSMLHKYQCDNIFSYVVSHVAGDWPTTLEGWLEVDKRNTQAKNEALMDEYGSEYAVPDDILPEPAATLRFAVKYGGKDMVQELPAILYDLARISYSDEFESKDKIGEPFISKGARWNLLRTEDFLRVGKAKEQLSELVNSILYFPPDRSAPVTCKDVARDEVEIEKIREEIQRRHLVYIDVLQSLTRFIGCTESDPLSKQYGLCSSCVLRVHNQLLEEQRSAWSIVKKLAGEYKL